MGSSSPLTSHEEMKGKRQVRETKCYTLLVSDCTVSIQQYLLFTDVVKKCL